jgi:hypothetical protein
VHYQNMLQAQAQAQAQLYGAYPAVLDDHHVQMQLQQQQFQQQQAILLQHQQQQQQQQNATSGSSSTSPAVSYPVPARVLQSAPAMVPMHMSAHPGMMAMMPGMGPGMGMQMVMPGVGPGVVTHPIGVQMMQAHMTMPGTQRVQYACCFIYVSV